MTVSDLRNQIDQKKFREAISAIDRATFDSAIDKAEADILRTQAMLALGDYDNSYVDRAI